jgi:hypothetical protein
MKWDTVERRWKQFLDVLRGREQNPIRANRKMATATRNDAVIELEDRRDELNGLADTAVFGEDALQIRRPTAPNQQGVVTPAEPSEPKTESDDKSRQEQTPRVFVIRACLQHQSRRDSVHAGSSRRPER